MKRKKLIDLHREWMKTGLMTKESRRNVRGGLCGCLPLKYIRALKLFEPGSNQGYWADGIINAIERRYHYTKLRQTIVLFICAMHEEI